MKNIKPWLSSFLNIFVLMCLFMIGFRIITNFIFSHNFVIKYVDIIFPLVFASAIASKYKNINIQMPIRNKDYLIVDLKTILKENEWIVKKADNKKIELKIPFLDRLLFSKLEIKLFDNHIELYGYKKYVDELKNDFQILS